MGEASEQSWVPAQQCPDCDAVFGENMELIGVAKGGELCTACTVRTEPRDLIPVTDLVRALLARLGADEWYLISEVLDDRADEAKKGNWIHADSEDAAALAHNNPETLRGVTRIARGIAEWTDEHAEEWGGFPLEAISRAHYEKIMGPIDAWRLAEDAEWVLRRCVYGLD